MGGCLFEVVEHLAVTSGHSLEVVGQLLLGRGSLEGSFLFVFDLWIPVVSADS